MYNIVIPTYEKHFNYNLNFLDSIVKYCKDKEELKIHFILSTSNCERFKKLIESYDSLNINVATLSQLIKNLDEIDVSDNVGGFPNKYIYQSLKKIFAYTITGDDYIVLDSENLCLKPFFIKDVFKGMKDKRLIFSKTYAQPIQKEVVNNCNSILSDSCNKWFFIKSYWFYEKDFVEKMIEDLKERYDKSCYSILKSKKIFEYQLYCQYIVSEGLKETFCADEYDEEYTRELNKSMFNFEYVCTVLNEENLDRYYKIINENSEKIIRLHWMSEKIKDNLIKNTDICIGTFHWD